MKRRRRKSRYSLDKRKDYNLQRHYGRTLAEFQEVVKAQGGLCCICFQPLTRPHQDHNHKTKQVRGVLCERCNKGLGFFLDEPALLVAAAKYLLKWKNELRTCTESDRQGTRESCSETRPTI